MSVLILLVTVLVVALSCWVLYIVVAPYFDKTVYHPTSEDIFSHYLAYSGNDELLGKARNIIAEEWSMGQGVYMRFQVDKEQVIEFLDRDSENPSYNHYPYATVAYDEFIDAYAERADRSIEW